MRDSILVSLAVGFSVFATIMLVMLAAVMASDQPWIFFVAAGMGAIAFIASFVVELATSRRSE